MSDLSQQNNESTVIAENTGVSLNLGTGNNARERINALTLQKIHLLPPVRKEKVLKVRQQLSNDGYGLDKRLNAVLDRLLEELVA